MRRDPNGTRDASRPSLRSSPIFGRPPNAQRLMPRTALGSFIPPTPAQRQLHPAYACTTQL
eukprot:6583967-Alexandrium_andersonii.AAC.1